MNLTDERLREIRAACINDADAGKVFDIQGAEMGKFIDELLLRREQKLYKGAAGDASDLAAKICIMVDEADLDDTDRMLAIGGVTAAVIGSSESWKPYAALCALLELLAHRFNLTSMDLLGEVNAALVKKLASEGDEAASKALGGAKVPRSTRPHRAVSVGRRFRR